jgi:hypothetical protein
LLYGNLPKAKEESGNFATVKIPNDDQYYSTGNENHVVSAYALLCSDIRVQLGYTEKEYMVWPFRVANIVKADSVHIVGHQELPSVVTYVT